MIVFLGLLISTVSSLTLSNTQKPRQTKYSSSTPPASGSLVSPANEPVTPGTGIATYSVKTSNGAVCILVKTDGLIEVRINSYRNYEQMVVIVRKSF